MIQVTTPTSNQPVGQLKEVYFEQFKVGGQAAGLDADAKVIFADHPGTSISPNSGTSTKVEFPKFTQTTLFRVDFQHGKVLETISPVPEEVPVNHLTQMVHRYFLRHKRNGFQDFKSDYLTDCTKRSPPFFRRCVWSALTQSWFYRTTYAIVSNLYIVLDGSLSLPASPCFSGIRNNWPSVFRG